MGGSRALVSSLSFFFASLARASSDDIFIAYSMTFMVELNELTLRSDDHNSKGMITLSKLLFTAFIWHIWRGMNARIFRKSKRKPDQIMQYFT